MPKRSSSCMRVCSISALSPKPLSITCMPASAKAWAMPSPMPLVEPVTMAVLPASWPARRAAGCA